MSGYEQDFYAWANQQAALLRAGKVGEADIENIAEEIESMGRSEKRELVSRLKVLLLHLLKWQFQPTHRGTSWEVSIANNRDQIADHLSDNPSLKPQMETAIQKAYRYAFRDALSETGLDLSTFPETCPWTAEQIVDHGFWPS